MERMLCGLGGLTVLVLFAIGLEIIRSRHLKAEIKKMDMLKKQFEEYYVQIQENNVDLQELSAGLEEQKESVESLLVENDGKGDGISQENIFGYTGIAMLDVVLLRKQEAAKEREIRFLIEAEKGLPFLCEEDELVSLFENLLDNAIEACILADRQCGYEEQDLSICLQIRKRKNELERNYISIENTKKEDMHPIESHFATWKTDQENHGNGIGIIQTIVKKYQGTIEFADKGKSFQIIICL